jgi:protein-S-isoprenylcysteine O-methyltransferase Ste14
MLPFVLVLWVLAIMWWTAVWIFALLVVVMLIGLQSVTSLSLRIRHEEQREKADSAPGR